MCFTPGTLESAFRRVWEDRYTLAIWKSTIRTLQTYLSLLVALRARFTDALRAYAMVLPSNGCISRFAKQRDHPPDARSFHCDSRRSCMHHTNPIESSCLIRHSCRLEGAAWVLCRCRCSCCRSRTRRRDFRCALTHGPRPGTSEYEMGTQQSPCVRRYATSCPKRSFQR